MSDPGFSRWPDNEGRAFVPAHSGLLDGLADSETVSGLSLVVDPKEIATIPGLPQHVYDDAARSSPGISDQQPGYALAADQKPPAMTQDDSLPESAHGQAWDSLSRYAQSAVAHDQAQMSLGSYADLLAGDHSVDIPQRHWSLQNSSVILSPEMEGKIDPVARQFYSRTGRDLVVTSGYRTPAEQAQAMYDKFNGGDSGTYGGPLGREIKSIYDAGVAARTGKAAILNQMSSKIGEQMTNGHFVSKHLQDQAVDFRDRDLTAQQKGVLGGIIRSNAGIALPEGIPRHTHASFPPPKR